nr:MAG TPA: hypothetical protein [Caudoviricetes sp.]
MHKRVIFSAVGIKKGKSSPFLCRKTPRPPYGASVAASPFASGIC